MCFYIEVFNPFEVPLVYDVRKWFVIPIIVSSELVSRTIGVGKGQVSLCDTVKVF